MLNYEQLQAAANAAGQHFKLIRQKYPAIKAYLVYSSTAGQVVLGSAPAQILDEFPAMIFDDANKTRALPLLERSKIDSLPASEKMRVNEELANIGRRFEFEGQCQVELRFSELNYKLIWQLQTDELVDRELTPQTKASIRIVLGTVEQISRLGTQFSRLVRCEFSQHCDVHNLQRPVGPDSANVDGESYHCEFGPAECHRQCERSEHGLLF